MATLEQLINSVCGTVATNDIHNAFNQHLLGRKIDIHDWEKQIPHLVSFITKAAKAGKLEIVSYLHERFLKERPAGLIAGKTHPDYQLAAAFIAAAHHGHLKIVEKLWAEAKWNHISLQDVQMLVLNGKLNPTQPASQFLFQIALDLENSVQKKVAVEPIVTEETSLQKAIKRLRTLEIPYGYNAVELSTEMISAVQTLNNPFDVIKLHKAIEGSLVDRLESNLEGDTTAIISKIAKQRVLELVFLTHDSGSPMPYNQSISTFLNTSHRSWSPFFFLGVIGTTQSKDIYDKLYIEKNLLAAKRLHQKENIKLQDMRDTLSQKVKDYAEGLCYM